MALTAKRYTITAALPYTNGPIHIGHLAGVYVPADIYSRYLRAQKKDVAFKEIIDKYDGMIRKSFDQLGISFDNYSRTSAPIHHETASDIFSKMQAAGQFVEEVTEQLYDPEAKQYLADRFVTGTCPKCNHTEAYGDQCEQCGSSLNATELINPKSTLSGAEPILKETKHWFLPLDQYEDFMKEWVIEGHKDDWKPNVYGQVKSWVDEGLRPRAVTRDLDWGIPVPVEGADGKVLYVWFDAPIGYISSTKEWAAKNKKDWEPYWKDKGTSLVHFIGKDNIVFHCIIFPCILKAAGDYILPENVPANEFLNLEGNKISTSKNWAVWLHEYLEEFPGQEDVLRYVLTANAPETKDNDFTWKDFQARNNNELVAIFGNFINRVSVLTQKYYDGSVPARKNQTPEDKEALDKMKAFPAVIGESIERFRFREASQELMNLARLGNKYLADQEPWKLIKVDPERVETIMNIALQIAATLATVSEPFLPHSAQKLRAILNITNPTEWNAIATTENLLVAGHLIGSQELLFAKVEDSNIQAQLDKLEATKKNNADADFELTPVKENISFEQFNAMDLRTGTVIEAEKIKKTKKLLKLKVDLGFESRTIVSGIAASYTPEEMVGKKVTVLANLGSRTIKGVESQGMLLMTENKDGKLIVIGPEDASMDNGFEIN